MKKTKQKQYWLVKSEPGCYSIDDLARESKTGKGVSWSGVRNYQARNFMKEMQAGDSVLFYHSGTAFDASLPAIVGLAEVSSEAAPDVTAQSPKDEHYDPKATKANPIWYCVDMVFVEKFPKPVTLAQIKFRQEFGDMMVTQRGSRLSVQPVSEKDFKGIVKLSKEKMR